MSTATVPATTLPSGETVPVLGQGTWHMGEDPARREDELAAIRLGLDLGLTLVDTAELYGDELTNADLATLDQAFPPPTRPRPLEIS